MRWLFYSPQDNSLARSAEKYFAEYIPADCLDRVYGFDSLREYFHRPQVSPSHIFLIINTKEELFEISDYKPIIIDMKCFIGLTNRGEQELANKAFEFHPRFIAYLPNDLAFLELVLQKVTGGQVG